MKIILVSHGDFVKGLLSSAQMIVGEQDDISAFGLYPTDNIETLKKTIQDTIEQYKGEEILFLTDLSHGSPFNIVVSLMNNDSIYHITGINLPLLIEIIMMRNSDDISCKAICDEITKKVQNSIQELIYDVKKYLDGVI
ncbi:MAG: PTS sugar transporter subunit IIA [Clostridiaceae bacterium]